MSALLCPHCGNPLAFGGREAKCVSGHSFDQAKSGYLNLKRRSKSSHQGDDKAQIGHRAAFLNNGWLDPVVEEVLRILPKPTIGKSYALLDTGCGTGHYSQRIIEGLAENYNDSIENYAFDLSKEAADRTAKKIENCISFVADIWAGWPLASGSMDVVLNIFSPKNFSEKARVLKTGGIAVIVFPAQGHLAEIRKTYELMGVEDGKLDRYMDAAHKYFNTVTQKKLAWKKALPADDVRAAILMGPNGKHVSEKILGETSALDVSFDVHIVTCAGPNQNQLL